MFNHEPLELLSIPWVAEFFHEFREFALGGDELLAFFFQPREFSGAPFVEGTISGRAHAKTGGGLYRKAPAAGTARPVHPVRPFFPFFSAEGNKVAGVTGFLLPKFPAQDHLRSWYQDNGVRYGHDRSTIAARGLEHSQGHGRGIRFAGGHRCSENCPRRDVECCVPGG